MDKFISLTASGIAFGAVIALVALGFIVLYKATGVINFAHGDMVTLGTYIAIWLVVQLGLPTVAGYVLAILGMFLVGVVLERVAHAPLRRRPPMTVVIATLAAAIAIRGGIALWQGSSPKSLPSPVGNSTVHIGGAVIATQRLLVVGVAAVVLLVLMLMFQRTMLGRWVRAVAVDPEAAQLQGVRTRLIAILAFGLSASLATLAGVLIAPLSSVDLNFGFTLMVTAFAAAVLGGFTSLGGVVIGALIIGLVQQLAGGYIFTKHSASLPFLVLIIVIAVRPGGLVSLQRSRV